MPLYRSIFRSVKIDVVKTLQPKAGPVEKEKPKMTFDVDGAMRHELILNLKHFIVPSVWLTGLFFAAVVAGFALAITYGFLALGKVLNLGGERLGGAEIAFLSAALVVFVAAWVVFTVFLVIKRAKKDLIERERGAGNWKLIDEAKWDRFVTMLRLARERAEKQKKGGAA